MFNKENLSLYLVTDRGLAANRSLESIVDEAVRGGVTMVQLREKELCTRSFVELGLRLKKLLAGTGVPLIINDRIDVALAIDADGVHIGQSDMPYTTCRRLLGADKIIGLSVENFEQLKEADLLDVDYVAASPVFATQTKTDTARPWGLDGLKEFASRSAHPVVAIGGMNSRTAASVIGCGVDGIAVVSDIVAAENPQESARVLKQIVTAEKERLAFVDAVQPCRTE